MNILELIRRITRHPQKQAVQNDLDKKQSFNAFSAESKKAIKESGNIEISEIVNTEPKFAVQVLPQSLQSRNHILYMWTSDGGRLR